MKFLKPINKKANARPEFKPHTFGESRANQMNQSLANAEKERIKLVQKEYLSPDPLNKVFQQKGFNLDAKIRKLKDAKK